MNKGKISCILTAAMITTQFSPVAALADNKIELINNVSAEDSSSEIQDDNTEQKPNESVDSNKKLKVTGKLELDMNFSMPIKNMDKEKTNIKVTLMKEGNEVGQVQLGNDNLKGKIGDVNYTLQALDGKRIAIESDAEELSFYQLTFTNLDLGNYSLKIEGEGYTTANVSSIDITKSS